MTVLRGLNSACICDKSVPDHASKTSFTFLSVCFSFADLFNIACLEQFMLLCIKFTWGGFFPSLYQLVCFYLCIFLLFVKVLRSISSIKHPASTDLLLE